MIGLMAPLGVSISTIMMICVPATLIGVAMGAIATFNKGKELKDDPEYQRRLAEGLIKPAQKESKNTVVTLRAKLSVALFLTSAIVIVLLGLIPALRPMVETAKGLQPLSMSPLSRLRCSLCLPDCVVMPAAGRSDYQRYGISGGRAGDCLRLRHGWMSETFVNGHIALIKAEVQTLLQQHTAYRHYDVFRVRYGQQPAATTLILLPLGLALGLPAYALIGSGLPLTAISLFRWRAVSGGAGV